MLPKYKIWLESVKDGDLKEELLSIINNEEEICDRFYCDLTFGTGGLRGKVGAGTNRMNVYIVKRATKGLGSYITENYLTKKVVIAYDSRIKSREFAFFSAEVFSSMDIQVFVFKDITPTPILSYAVRELGASMGIVITASHNPKEYNGYKVYNERGCQITDKVAEDILKRIEKVDYFSDFTPNAQKISVLGSEIQEKFLKEIKKYSFNGKTENLNAVYTPLNGTGNIPVRTMLKEMGVNVTVVKEQEHPDCNFTTCPYPNPEEKESLYYALKYAENSGVELVFATDPDADRVGVAVRDVNGEYVLLNGNETGILILYYILSKKAEKKSLGENPTVIKTIVTSDMVFDIAKTYGVGVKEVLTGFKYIGEEIENTDNFVMGLEESYGYLVGLHARDKDAISAIMIIAEACSYYKKQNKTLLDVLKELCEKFGWYKTELKSVKYEGADGMEKMKTVIDIIRKSPILEYKGKKVEFTDFSLGINGLPKSNVLRFRNEDFRLIIRPSGTEPKLKIYYQVKGLSEDGAIENLKELINFSVGLTN